MNIECPNCGKLLKLSEKFKGTLLDLKPGQKVRIKCTYCTQPFPVDAMAASGTSQTKKNDNSEVVDDFAVKPPEPPDVSWLSEGIFEDQEVIEEIPLALILMPDGDYCREVVKAIEGLGYRAELAQTAEEAMEKMEFVNYSSVVLHSAFETGGLLQGTFHQFMKMMTMSKRRYIFYVLIGPELKTLYDLEALAFSANIVVNENDLPYFGTILRKAIPDYEALFGPLMEELRIVGS